MKRMTAAFLLAAVSLLGRVAAQAEGFPTAPIKVVVPYAAGGTADVVARLVAQKAAADLGQPVLVDNRTGAGGVVGTQLVARAKPDGYTVLQISTTHVIVPSLEKNLPYDWERDFIPVFGVCAVPEVLAVSSKSSIRSLADLVQAAKASPKGIAYSSGGTGTLGHLTSARLVQELKLNATHVPYRGLSEGIQAVLAGQVTFTVVNVPDVLEQARAGNARLLGVTSEQRLPYLPDVPTMTELGFANAVMNADSWTAYMVPAKTPPEVVERLTQAFAHAASDSGVQQRLGKIGVVVKPLAGPELGRYLRAEWARWHRVVEDNHIRIEN